MKSSEYRQILKTITRNTINRRFPGLKKKCVEDVAMEIAKTIHARMYGANVDGVDSPIWRDWPQGENQHCKGVLSINQPTVEAKELLND